MGIGFKVCATSSPMADWPWRVGWEREDVLKRLLDVTCKGLHLLYGARAWMFLEIEIPNSVRTGLSKWIASWFMNPSRNTTQKNDNKLWKTQCEVGKKTTRRKRKKTLKKSEEHNAEILLIFWTINIQEYHYKMDIKGIAILSAMDYLQYLNK